MSSIPAEGYLYSQCSFKPEERKEIDSIFQKVNDKLAFYGAPDFLSTKNVFDLDNVTFSHLYEISVQWQKYILELESVHFKMAVVKEFRNLNFLIEKSKEKIEELNDLTQELEDSLRKEYSEIVSQNAIFSEYFSFKEFKKVFSLMTSPEQISIKKALALKHDNLFRVIRRKIIAEKANIHFLMSETENSVIHLKQIKKQDEKTYDLLRMEFFNAVSDEALGFKLPFAKSTHTEILRPSHVLAKTLKIEKTEIVYLTVSLDPIEDVDLDEGSNVEFLNGMKFELTKTQQVVEKEMFYKLELDKLTTCNLAVPFYFSFIRFNLVKEQRTDHLK